MSEQEFREENRTEKTQPVASGAYQYRWSYGDQCAFEQGQRRKKKRGGVLVYAIVMTAVFAVCIGLLVGVLAIYGAGGYDVTEDTSNTDGALTTAEVSELVTPSTVLIYASGQTASGYGTGFFIRENGYIATNYHVVENREYISVTLHSGEELEAELINYSEPDDLAVIKVADGVYPAVKIGNSDAISVGDVAIAIGNPSGANASWSTTQGIISALNREVTVTQTGMIEELTMIQTDAPVNPGNSGGPLCNDRGEVIGIVTRKLTDYEGIGLAIPINGAMEILNAIVDTGSADGVQSSISKVRPTIGITVQDIKVGDKYYDAKGNVYTSTQAGVFVVAVDAAGSASGKLKPGDIITSINGETIENQDDLKEQLYSYEVGDDIVLLVWRDGQTVSVLITLGKAS